MTAASITNLFYGPDAAAASTGESAKPPGEQAKNTPPANDQSQAKAGDDSKPPRKSDEEVFFGDAKENAAQFEQENRYELDRVATGLMMSPQVRKAFVDETAQIFGSLPIATDEAQQFVSLYAQHILNPPAPETDAQRHRDGLAQLNQQYGFQEANRRLTRVNSFLKLPENNTLREELVATRLANHPKVITAFCEIADKLQIPK